MIVQIVSRSSIRFWEILCNLGLLSHVPRPTKPSRKVIKRGFREGKIEGRLADLPWVLKLCLETKFGATGSEWYRELLKSGFGSDPWLLIAAICEMKSLDDVKKWWRP